MSLTLLLFPPAAATRSLDRICISLLLLRRRPRERREVRSRCRIKASVEEDKQGKGEGKEKDAVALKAVGNLFPRQTPSPFLCVPYCIPRFCLSTPCRPRGGQVNAGRKDAHTEYVLVITKEEDGKKDKTVSFLRPLSCRITRGFVPVTLCRHFPFFPRHILTEVVCSFSFNANWGTRKENPPPLFPAEIHRLRLFPSSTLDCCLFPFFSFFLSLAT